MSDSLGLSIGVANFVAARVGSVPLTRRSVLTLFGNRPPEVGVPEDNPNLTEPGLVLRGFTERIGDPAPFLAPDGSTHHSDVLAVEALDAMARAVGYGKPVAIAVPGHWGQNAVAKLGEAMRSKPALAPDGEPPMLISDATAALAALYAKPGFPTDGVVALCDFGAGGTSVTLTDAAANFRHIGETVRCSDFSGNQVDQAILRHLQASFGGAGATDATGTEPLRSPAQRLDECRRAKEQLSAATVAVVPAGVPGAGEDIRLSRTELENLISDPLERCVTTVQEILRRTEIPTARLAAVATVGGGACIPLVTQQLEERLQVPVVTTPQPTLSAAIGAAVLVEQRSSASAAGASTGVAAGATAPAGLDAGAPTEVVSPAWAADAARAAPGESPEDGLQSATYRALAWSQDASSAKEPLPYTGEDHSGEQGQRPAPAPPAVAFEPAVPAPERTPRHKRPGVIFSLAAAAALVALLGAGLVAFKLSTSSTSPLKTTSSVTPSELPSVGPIPPPPPPTSETPASTESVVPPPPSTTEPTLTTTVPTTTVPTTTVPTTTVPTTTPPTTRPTTTSPTTTYSNPPFLTYPPTTTARIPPLVPVTPTYGR
ncbi:Hsp70 family protein [Mycobacterium sp.]|uniref:Hsp70 family protein n=1 Tax=Mycobacterium sp. TaxID=1785 RepID=UPI003D6A8A88